MYFSRKLTAVVVLGLGVALTSAAQAEAGNGRVRSARITSNKVSAIGSLGSNTASQTSGNSASASSFRNLQKSGNISSNLNSSLLNNSAASQSARALRNPSVGTTPLQGASNNFLGGTNGIGNSAVTRTRIGNLTGTSGNLGNLNSNSAAAGNLRNQILNPVNKGNFTGIGNFNQGNSGNSGSSGTGRTMTDLIRNGTDINTNIGNTGRIRDFSDLVGSTPTTGETGGIGGRTKDGRDFGAIGDLVGGGNTNDPGNDPPPADPGTGTPPADPGTGTPPADPGTGTPPADPGTGTPPADPGTGTPPADPGTGTPPADPGQTPPPCDQDYCDYNCHDCWWGSIGFPGFFPVVTEVVPIYTNPYIGAPATVVSAPPVVTEPAPAVVEQLDHFQLAQIAFKAGNMPEAKTEIGLALKESPANTDMQQFASLILFATKEFKTSAVVAYNSVQKGSNWNWDTVRSFYPSASVYEGQLRQLETFVAENPKDAPSRFLLSYHYLVMEHFDAARKQLTVLVGLQPKDQLAAAWLKGLSGASDAKPQPATALK